MGADTEVEEVLREIRLHLRAQADSRGAGEADLARQTLVRMEADLTVTARAWSRLPPMASYRGGTGARLELWVKRLIKRAAHWFTWEQVNFNSAVNDALRAAHSLLAEQAKELEELRARVERLSEEREFDAPRAAVSRGGGADAANGREGEGRAAAN